MHTATKLLGFTAMLAIAACNGQSEKLTIRSTGTPLAAAVKPVSSRVAEGRSQFALGNVALALESFRKAVRQEPGNIDAITGVAACYDRMGRYDLSRKHYEAALAVEPANEHALAALAESLHLQGRVEEAAAVRGEIRQRLDVTRAALSPASPKHFASTKLPPSASEPTEKSAPLGDSDRQVRRLATATAMSKDPAPVLPTPPAAAGRRGAPVVPVRAVPNPVTVLPTAPARSVTIMLPPPRPVSAPASKQAVAVTPIIAKPIKFGTGPRLERTSMAEVTLVTRHVDPMRRPQPDQRTAQTSTMRFGPLRQVRARVPMRVLNAARVNRLAANTRVLMMRRGWKNIAIGNAAAVRNRSIIIYPANVRQAAQRLAAQFGFPSVLRSGTGEVTVLLGSDAAALVKKRAAI